MVHFLKQRTKHLTVQILGFLTIHIADVTEHLEMQRGEGGEERERVLYNFYAYIYLSFKM